MENTQTINQVKLNLPVTSLKTAIICALIFFIIQLLGIVHHEPWMDEYQAFQIAMNSHSIGNLFYNMREEGHGAVWFIILYIITRFTHNIFAMQIVHISIATAGIFVFFRYAPFSLFEKVLISLGYFFFYEYAQISREYVIGIFCIICICSVIGEKYYPRKSTSTALQPSLFYIVACLLFLLADISWYDLTISVSLAAYFLLIVWDERKIVATNKKLKTALVFAILVVLAGWATAIFQMMPPPDNTFATAFQHGFQLSNLGRTLSQVTVSYFPFPVVNDVCWNTYYIWPKEDDPITFISILVIAIISLSFIKKPKILFLYIISIVLISGFTLYANIFIFSRYLGHSFIALFICFWFDRYIPANQNILQVICQAIYKNISSNFIKLVNNGVDLLKKGVFYIIIITQAATGLFFYYMGYTHPFSNTSTAGNYILQNHLDRFPLMGALGWVVAPLSYYTNKPVFILERNDTSRFVIYDTENKNVITAPELFSELAEQINKNKGDTILICTYFDLPAYIENANYSPEKGNFVSAYQIKNINSITTVCLHYTCYYFYLAWKKK